MSQKKHTLWQLMVGTQSDINRCPWVTHLIEAYLGIVVITYVLLLIAPFVTLISSTPFSKIRMFLGLLGAALLVLDLFTNKGLWHSTYCILLYGICITAAVSAFLLRRYGIKDNLFDFCWVLIQLGLSYSLGTRLSFDEMRRFSRIVFTVTLIIWTAACLVSLYQFGNQIGYRYYYNPNSDSPELCRQGFLQHRLFGVFTGLDYAAYISLAHLIVGISCFIKNKRVFIRILLVLALLPIFLHLVLSGSRSAQIALFVYAFVFGWLLCRSSLAKSGWKSFFVKLLTAILALILTVGMYSAVKKTAVYIPPFFSKFELVVEESLEELGSGLSGNTKPHKKDPVKKDKDLLTRTEVQDDISNERFTIWKNYLSLYKEVGLFGLSLSNYNDYISENHPDLYIVRYFQNKLGEVEKTDLVYECHNNYLFVFISTGWFGLLLFLTFALLTLIRLIRYILTTKKLSLLFITALAIVGIGCVQALFMNSVILKINAPSFPFWLALGFVNALAGRKETSQIPSAVE